jgi:predicted MPP superfamily phosphohydrolase
MLDSLIPLLFAICQCRLAILALRRVEGRRARQLLVLGILLFEMAMAVGYACGYSAMAARFPFHATVVFAAISYSYLLLSACLAAVHAVVEPVRKHLSRDTDLGRRKALAIAGNTLIAAPFAAVGYGALIERTRFEVRETDVPLAGLPPDLDGLRILQLSDIHLGIFLSERELAKVIDAACELRPHVAFATGDFISSVGDPLEACLRQLARVKSDAGVWGCLGNHEHYARVEDEATRLAARMGMCILRGEACGLRFGNSLLNVAGVDYQGIWQRERYLAGAERLVDSAAANVLLSHNPDVFPVAANQGYSLVLAGHTHGGQVTIEILDQSVNPARFYTKYVRGLYRIGPAAEYVTRGIGTIGIPARLGAPPEITLIRLRKA